MASPLAIPRRNFRQSSTSTAHSQSLSASLESRRVTEQPLIPSSPSTPDIMTASSSASLSSTSTSRRSLPRRGSSLPVPTPVQQRERRTTRQESFSLDSSDNQMSMLQFISSTSTPSWAEVEASPLAEVPTNFPPILHDDVDMVTFLREAPGVNRTPQTRLKTLELDLQEDTYLWSLQSTENTDADEEEAERQVVVTPELGSSATVNEAKGNEVSLQAFLEEQAVEEDGARLAMGFSSPNPSMVGVGEIYGETSNPNLSSYGLTLDVDGDLGQALSRKPYSPYNTYGSGSSCTLEDTLRSESLPCKGNTISRSDKRESIRSRVVSAPSPTNGHPAIFGDSTSFMAVDAVDGEERKRRGVSRVMRLAREALGMKRA